MFFLEDKDVPHFLNYQVHDDFHGVKFFIKRERELE